MRLRRIAIIATAGALAAGGAGAAVGATSADKGKEIEARILADAAKRLGTTADKLRDALAAAEDAQLDQAVKDGDLTQEQADAIKKRRAESGRVLGVGPGPGFRHGPGFRLGPGFGHGPGIPGRVGFVDDVAKALGLSARELFTQLRDGKSLADIAKAQGKSKAEVKAAVTAAAKTRLDRAVDDGDLTRKQADALLSRLGEEFDEHWDDSFQRGMRGHHFGPPPIP